MGGGHGGPRAGYVPPITVPSQHRSFRPDGPSVRSVRSWVRDAVGAWGCDADPAVLVASELATNAVLHARSTYTVTVSLEDEVVCVAVHDDNPRPPVCQPPPPGALSGRGLQLVDSIARAWGVQAEPGDGKTVWARV